MPDPFRREFLAVGLGACAAVAGGVLAWWRLHGTAPSPANADALWTQKFQTPAGAALPVASLKGKHLLVNFWATWCPPCVEELPLLDRFFRENASSGWQVLGLAVDQPAAVREFLKRTPVTFPIGMVGLGGAQLGKQLGNATGGLPYTVLFRPDGTVGQRRIGGLTAEQLAEWKAAATRES